MKILVSIFFLMTLTVQPLMANNEKHIYGYVEKVTLPAKNLTLSAKLDTGAKSASLHATHITEFNKDGTPYLRFIVATKDHQEYTFEAPYIGKVKIKTRANESGGILASKAIKRPVVLLDLQLGTNVQTLRVNLTNRKRFNYPLLLGRDSIIAFKGAVDPALKFTVDTSTTNHEK